MLPCPACGHQNPDEAPRCERCSAPMPTRPDPRTVPAVVDATAATVAAPSAPPRAGGLLTPGSIFDGKYRIERQLGAGGMSVVYLATELTVEAPAVIKALLPQLSRDDALRERLLREARALARIDHPNVVRLKSAVIDRGELFLVMEYVEGEDLSGPVRRWAKGPGPTLDEAMRLFSQVVDGVEAAHQEGIVHRDIKPSNVLIRARDGRVKVTDFGIAKLAEQAVRDQKLTGGLIGTLWYMAPEQLRADPTIDARADVYSLGILLFEMLAGAVPFDGPSDYEIARKHLHEPLPPIKQRRPASPLTDAEAKIFDEAIARCCAKDRAARLGSCDELRRALAPFWPGPRSRAASSLPPAGMAPLAEPPAPTAAPRRSRSIAWPVLLLLAVVGVGLASWQFFSPEAGRPGPADARSAGALPVATGKACKADPECVEAPAKGSPACVKGRCGFRCDAGLLACGSSCVDPQTDMHHCGGCEGPGRDCAASRVPPGASAVCQRGSCGFVCPKGLFDCGNACLDLRADPRHCGACSGPGSDCTQEPLPAGAKAVCADGRCDFSCPQGGARCGKACCAPGQACEEGACVSR